MKIFYLLLIAALVLQVVSGNMDIGLFTFPVNILVIAVILYLAFAEYRKRKKKELPPDISSKKSILVAAGALAVCGLVILAFPQFPAEGTTGIWPFGIKLGLYGFTRSWIFAAVVLWTLIVLASFIIRKIASRRKWGRPGFAVIITAIALWVVIAGFFLGSPDMINVRVDAYSNFATNIGTDRTGKAVTLPVNVRAEKVVTEEQSEGTLSVIYAEIRLTGKDYDRLYAIDPGRTAAAYLFKSGKWIITLDENEFQAGSASDHCVIRMVDCPWYYVICAGCFTLVVGLILIPLTAMASSSRGRKTPPCRP